MPNLLIREARLVLTFTVSRGKVVAIDLIADANRLSELDLAFLND